MGFEPHEMVLSPPLLEQPEDVPEPEVMEDQLETVPETVSKPRKRKSKE